MSVVMHEGRPPVPVRYDSWAEWRRYQAEEPQSVLLVPAHTVFCALCWGNGRVLEPARNGEGLVPVACAHCAGFGLVRAPD